uniref:ABC transporter domain-containing protein n=1 Tax=Capra hircus TaxID=9925 RepID=A0A8C2S5Q6_CAPHI
MIKKERSVCQQTRALLHKNFLRKWRMKKESVLEWTMVLFPGLALCLFAELFRATHFLEQPPQVLGRVDEFNDSDPVLVAYTPVTNVTQSIMDKVAAADFMKGATILGIPNEDAMDRVRPRNDSEMVGIVFNDTFSYRLKFSWGHRVPVVREHFEYSDHCWALRDEAFCLLSIYWQKGFVAFQTAINAAIIEVTANRSAMEELTSVVGINMRTPPFISKGEIINEWFIFICIVYFSPFVYVASLNITKERKKFKKLMTGMGLQQSAFWLSWVLMYAGFISVVSVFMTLVIKLFQMIVLTGFMVVVTLFTLYGLSLIALAFLLCVLIKRPILTGVVASLFTVFWGCLGFTALYRQLPSSLGWALCLFSPFAFTAGVAQISHQEYHVSAVVFPDPSGESNTMIVVFFLLAFDTLLYLTLTLYFEHILPGKIRNLKKEYKGKPGKVEALQGICLDVYEGQLTAILGHSGAGKSSLLSILGGWSACTEGSATIYNTQLSEIMDMEEIRNCTGFCPQFNIYFDFLTVRENLRLFAKIKGIPAKEVEQEVKGIVMELDMHDIQDVIAKELSGGQKRKLTFGIAVLGDPQVLLLDEPTAGLDPFSRHLVWNFLKERKTNHTILFTTQFMDEADILADRKVFLSNGKLRCAGSSLFLKRKWGVGYHLSLHRDERCNTERITSLITQHISDAKLTAESEERLVYTLPLERTDRFPDLCRDLENSSHQGIMNFGVSMTTLTEVFLNLKGRSAIDEPGIKMSQSDVPQALRSLPGVETAASSAALWRRQVCAVARLRFLKLRNERKIFLSLLVVFGIALIPTVCERIVFSVLFRDHCWEFSPGMYFLSLEQLPQAPLTDLLIINNTGENIEDVVQSLKRQDLALEVDDARNRNGSDDPSYNGAIIVSGGHKVRLLPCTFLKRLSNQILFLNRFYFNAVTHGCVWSLQDDPRWAIGILDFLLLLVVNCLSPYVGMSSVSDYKQKAQSQLWISGLCPSAYWCGQALVDIPFYFGILVSVHLMYYIFLESTIVLEFLFALVVCVAGCAACLTLLTYVISFLFPTGRKNNGFWALSFFLKPVILASCLRKEYTQKRKRCFSARRTKTAVRNVSFCINKGEVLGLLGHSGAGKSTSVKMITGDTTPTAGVVRGGGPGDLGYCPQEDALWPSLTVREHLDLYAAVRGLAKDEAALSVSRLADALKLQDQMALPTKALPEGAKRKLSFALSILGTSSFEAALVVSGHPFSQMTFKVQTVPFPVSRQAIQAIVKSSARGALLTTHSMAEAEAVCDRVAVMVSGRLRCIGSIQHLKSKFGKDYLLEVKVKALTVVEPLHTEILKLFPQAARQERYSFVMAYKLPIEDVHPLSQTFSKLEAVKQAFDLEEYSLSQATLEQVFLELSKEQELGNMDDDVDTTVRWKLLPQEES